ncbi:hypothetical protein HC026_11175 [Lactobacillus sp. LC28-10]|uniref:Uncharacterized protein n=1 Tax=Secundilactobacillus angelensis TaxID=2722706 RepID=A0ABX1KZU1_9LACO|nr:hypothetical protein [Secundilactobacillus angelensis]MCH5463187.1 hypothetical protein [Secundilactobacillus angelensis]NLR19454.1 hypothetical protein [Secundilactobacillus angelensis]
MLTKNYSTTAIIMASNVLDGGKDIKVVPAEYQNGVADIIKGTTSVETPAVNPTVVINPTKEAK